MAEASDMKRMIDRVVAPDDDVIVSAMAMMLYSIPRVKTVDAIAVYPGQGETWRVKQALDDWETNSTARHLLVAGSWEKEVHQEQVTLEILREEPYKLLRTDGVITQVSATNTVEQAEWIAEQIKGLGLRSVSLYVSPYHLLRAYCTTLKSMQKHGLGSVQLIPMPVAMSPTTMIPEVGIDATDMFYGEAKRVRLYQDKGDVVTLSELKQYLGWLWTQPILAER